MNHALNMAALRASAVYMAGGVAELLSRSAVPIEQIAFHEAGHSVAAMLVNRCPIRIVISASGRSFVQFTDEDPVTNISQTDDEKIRAVVAVLQGAGQELDLGQVRAECTQMLLKNWRAVEAVAEVLVARAGETGRAQMTGKEFMEIYKFNQEENYVLQKK